MKKINKFAQQLGKMGGKKSAQSRLNGKSKAEISEMMRKLRYTKEQRVKIKEMSKEMVAALNKNVKNEQKSSKP